MALRFLVILSFSFVFTIEVKAEVPSLKSREFRSVTYQCTTKKNREQFLRALLIDVKSMSDLIEGVPPETYNFIKDEMDKIAKQGYPKSRYQLLLNNKYYPAYKVAKLKKQCKRPVNPPFSV